MSRVAKSHSVLTALMGAAVFCTSCGRTSLETFQSETGAGGGVQGGRSGAAGTSGGFSVGAQPAVGGMFTQAGTTSMSGNGGQGGAGLSGSSGAAGESPTCQLSVSDCHTPAQAECRASHPLCLGASNSFSRLSGLPEAHIVDVTTSREGRVAVTGYAWDKATPRNLFVKSRKR